MQIIQSHHKPVVTNAEYDVWRWASAVAAGVPPAISTATDSNYRPKDSLTRGLVTIFSMVKRGARFGFEYTARDFERG